MNFTLLAHLEDQKQKLQSASAYRTARTVINVLCPTLALAAISTAAFWLKTMNSLAQMMPEGSQVLYRIYLATALILSLCTLYLSWVGLHTFFDIADAALAISRQSSENQPPQANSPTVPSNPGPARPWPASPTPLLPQPDPADAKYMPKS